MAANYLISHGMKVLEHNFRLKQGEIDLICQDQDYLVFCEVKYRSVSSYGDPLEAVTPSKQRTIRNVASLYLMKNHLYGTKVRFDVVGILGDHITHIPNAF